MPRCPLHVQEDLEPKRKGWFCEECGAIVVDYQQVPLPADVAPADMRGGVEDPADTGGAHEEITRPRPVVAAPLGEAAEPLDDPPSWDLLARSSRDAARSTIARIGRGRRDPDLYVERAGVDEAVSAAALREKRAVLIVGGPGTGKTTWACRWVGSLLNDGSADDAVLFVSGPGAWRAAGKKGTDLLSGLVGAAGLKPGVVASVPELIARWAAERRAGDDERAASRRLIVVLDGLDEASAGDVLFGEIDAFVEEIGRNAWIRLIMTMRRATYDAASDRQPWAPEPPCPFRTVARLVTFYDTATRQVLPYVELRPWRKETEARSAYEVMQRSSPDASAAFRWEKLTPALRRLLCTPWCLPVFHDAFAGVDEAPSSLDAISLGHAWFDSLERTVPGLGKLLDEIGSAAMHARRLDVIDNAIAGWSAAQGDDGQRRVAALQSCGLLSWDASGTHFRHDRIAEVVLARELMRRIAPRVVPSADVLSTWARSAGTLQGAEAFPALAGALELLVTRWVTDGESGFILSLLDLEQDDVRQRLVAASLRALGAGWGDQEQAGPAATRLLDVLETASSKPERARRLLRAAWSSVAWLQGRGFGRAAGELVGLLVALARGMIGRTVDGADKQWLGRALCALAGRAEQLGNRDEALGCVQDALRLAGDGTAGGRPDAEWLRVQAMSLLQLAAMVRSDGNPADARTRGEEALRAARKLVELQGSEVSSHKLLIQTLLSLADAALEAGNPVQARGCADEAERAARLAAESFGRDAQLRRLRLDSQAVLARVCRAEQDVAAARELTDSALRSSRKLVRGEPQRVDYRLELAAMLEGHAAHLLAEHEGDLARRALDEAAGLMIALVEAHPDQTTWLRQVSQLLVTLGLVLRTRGESESSRACFEEAVRHARTYAGRAHSPTVGSELVMALAQLGHLEAAEGRRSEARRAFREALEIVRALDASGARLDDLPRVAAMLLSELGRLAAEDGDVESARWHVGEALKQLTAYMAVGPGRLDVQWELCHVMSVRAELASGGVARERRPARFRFAITVREPGVPGVKEYFDRDEITIGRAPGSDLMLPNYSVSRRHAVVRYERGRFSITDLGSKHGTKVNGKRVSGPTEISPADRVDLGDFALRFEAAGSEARDAREEDGTKSVSQAETTPPPPMTPEPSSATQERKETTIDLDVGDFVQVIEKAEDG